MRTAMPEAFTVLRAAPVAVVEATARSVPVPPASVSTPVPTLRNTTCWQVPAVGAKDDMVVEAGSVSVAAPAFVCWMTPYNICAAVRVAVPVDVVATAPAPCEKTPTFVDPVNVAVPEVFKFPLASTPSCWVEPAENPFKNMKGLFCTSPDWKVVEPKLTAPPLKNAIAPRIARITTTPAPIF